MKHPDHQTLRRLADGLLPSSEQRDVEAHLSFCDQCRREAAFERRVTQALRDIPMQEPSPRFDANVLRAVSRPGSPGTRVPWFRYAAAAALIITTLVVVIIAGGSGEEESRTVLSPVFEQITNWIKPLTSTLTARSDALRPTLGDDAADVVRIFLLATGALLLFGALERVVLPRIRGADHRH